VASCELVMTALRMGRWQELLSRVDQREGTRPPQNANGTQRKRQRKAATVTHLRATPCQVPQFTPSSSFLQELPPPIHCDVLRFVLTLRSSRSARHHIRFSKNVCSVYKALAIPTWINGAIALRFELLLLLRHPDEPRDSKLLKHVAFSLLSPSQVDLGIHSCKSTIHSMVKYVVVRFPRATWRNGHMRIQSHMR